MLDGLSARLQGDASGELYVLCAKLGSLRHRVSELDAGQRRELERATQHLRKPLSVLLEAAARGELSSAASRRDLRALIRSVRCIAEHLNDCELAGRLRVRYGRVDVTKLARSCCEAFARVAAPRTIDFTAPDGAAIDADVDADKIQAVLANLIYNAVKHTPAHGRIRCVLDVDAASSEVVIAVEDSGPSLPPARAAAMFERSGYLDRAHSAAHALGLNLAVSRDLATLHGGSLTLRNNADVGTTFELRVPCRAPHGTRVARTALLRDDLAARVVELARNELRAEAALAAGGQALAQHDDRPLLLIIEDTRSLHRLLADHFQREYRVASAFDGEEGLAKADALSPDLILTDLIMPRIDGRALIRALRDRRRLDATPIVVLTTKDDPDAELALLEHDVQDVIHKPFLLPEVAARVRNLISSKRARDVLSELVDRREADLIDLAGTVARQQRELQNALGQVQAARSFAESASRVKSNFLRMMSHELKTPLTAMQLQLELLAREPDFERSERLRKGHARIWRASRRLLHLIDTMLEWARVESGRTRLYPERLDLVALIDDVVRELSAQAQQKHLSVEVRVASELQREIVSDRRLVALVLVNLLGRALQVTPAGSVEIRVDQRGALRRIAIHDSSPHHAATSDARAFEPTQPGDAGAGLGLHVVQDIARAFGAELTFEQADGVGQVVTLALPSLDLGASQQQTAAAGAN